MALVAIQFGFEEYHLNFDRIQMGESTTDTAILVVRDPSKRGLIELSTKAPYVVASAIGAANRDDGRIEVEVKVTPETPPGKLNETITAALSDGSHSNSSLRIRGTVIGNIEVTPETVRFSIDESRSAVSPATQTIQLTSTSRAGDLRLLGVADTDGRLILEVDTVVAGQQYVVRAAPGKEALTLDRNVSGDVKILTNDAYQPEMTCRYYIVVPR